MKNLLSIPPLLVTFLYSSASQAHATSSPDLAHLFEHLFPIALVATAIAFLVLGLRRNRQ